LKNLFFAAPIETTARSRYKFAMERIPTEPTFTDAYTADLGGPRAKAFFAVCEREIPWVELADSIRNIFPADRPEGGAPHWPLVTMLKVTLMQKWFGLSDPMAEEMLKDRISFRGFIGLSFDDKTPDHGTICRFRQRLRDKGHGSTLFDPRSIIKDFVYDTASVSEHTHFDGLAAPEDKAIYADSGCRSKDRVEKLEKRGVFAGICHRRVRGQKTLTPEQKAFNRLVSGVRGMVEHPFAWIKRMTGGRTRYRGVTRNAPDFALAAVAYNFKRSFSLSPVK